VSKFPYSDDVREAIERELEAICSDGNFRSSQRNCEFLRYVVTKALEGRAAEIKEWTLGTELFGRPASYDTGSDAVVRVRANDVRRRLAKHYEEHRQETGWRIELPTRTYIPLFIQASEPSEEDHSVSEKIDTGVSKSVLNLRQLMTPTLVALFLCASTFRWQIFSGSPYFEFWETLVHGRSSVTLVLDADKADPSAVTTADLKEITPLLAVAQSFHATTHVQSSADSEPADLHTVRIRITNHDESQCAVMPAVSVPLEREQQGNEAYVTVIPKPVPELCISSANREALRLAIQTISTKDRFPQTLETALHRDTVSRVRIEDNQPVSAESVIADSEYK